MQYTYWELYDRSSIRRQRVLAVVALLLVLALAGSACAGSDPAATSAPASSSLDRTQDETQAEPETEADPEPDDPAGDDELDACTYAPDDANCGVLEVPENYDAPDGRTVSLPYVILPALGTVSSEPLAFLAGGPGQGTVSQVMEFAEYSELREGRDMIFLEQRGTGLSEPFLDCDEGSRESLKQCYESFVADGVDLGQYTTMNAAQDLVSLRKELGIEQWHLLGVSYGTTLALISMRTDPEGIASVILDSPGAPQMVIYTADVESELNNLSRVIAECEADPSCSSRYSDLFATHLATFDELKSDSWAPEDPEVAPLFYGDEVNPRLYQEVAIELSIHDPGAVPAYIAGLAARDEEALRGLTSLEWRSTEIDSEDVDPDSDSEGPDSEGPNSGDDGFADGSPAEAIDACVVDPDCSAKYPDLESDFEAMVAALDEEPWDLTLPENIAAYSQGFIGPSDLDALPALLQVTGSPEVVARFVAIVSSRDEPELKKLLQEVLPLIEGIDEGEPSDRPAAANPVEARDKSYGYTLSVYCAEEAPFFELDTSALETIDQWPDVITVPMLAGAIDDCEIWDVPPSDPADVAQVVSDIPTLIMAGQYDYLTPIRLGEIAAEGLSQAALIEVPGAGHGLKGDPCVRTIMAEFLRSGDVVAACLADIPPTEFQ